MSKEAAELNGNTPAYEMTKRELVAMDVLKQMSRSGTDSTARSLRRP